MEEKMNVIEKYNRNQEKLIHAFACWIIVVVSTVVVTIYTLPYGKLCIGYGILTFINVADFIPTCFILKKVNDYYSHFGIFLVIVVIYMLLSSNATQLIYGIGMLIFDGYMIYDFVIHPGLENLKLHQDYELIQYSLTGKEFIKAVWNAIKYKFLDVLNIVISVFIAIIRFIFWPIVLLLTLIK